MKRVLLSLALLVPTGCRYARDRALDLYDAVPVSLAAGYGASIQARATPYFGLGLGWNEAWRAGLDEHRFGPLWWEKERGIPLVRYYRYQDYLERCERWSGGKPRWWPETKRKRASTFLVLPGMTRDGELWWPWLPAYHIRAAWDWPRWSIENVLNIELGAFVGVVGIRVAVSPVQLFDFVVGFTTWDPVGDDFQELRVRWPDAGAPPSFEDPEDESVEDATESDD